MSRGTPEVLTVGMDVDWVGFIGVTSTQALTDEDGVYHGRFD